MLSEPLIAYLLMVFGASAILLVSWLRDVRVIDEAEPISNGFAQGLPQSDEVSSKSRRGWLESKIVSTALSLLGIAVTAYAIDYVIGSLSWLIMLYFWVGSGIIAAVMAYLLKERPMIMLLIAFLSIFTGLLSVEIV